MLERWLLQSCLGILTVARLDVCSVPADASVLTSKEVDQLDLLSWQSPRLLPATPARKKLASKLLPATKAMLQTTETELRKHLAGAERTDGRKFSGTAVQGWNSSHPGTESFRAGYTQILSGLELFLPAAAEVAAIIANQTGLSSVSVSSYAHPTQGEPICVHADAHDIFILQIQGCRVWKHWHGPSLKESHLVKHPGELGLGNSSSRCLNDSLGFSSRSLELHTGSLLRLPRGIAHQTSSCGQGPSSHWAIMAARISAASVLLDVAASSRRLDVHGELLSVLGKDTDLTKRLWQGLQLTSYDGIDLMKHVEILADGLLALLDEAIPGPWPALDRRSVSTRLKEVLQQGPQGSALAPPGDCRTGPLGRFLVKTRRIEL
ncbi:No66 [Symbiodinium microadriaticum]|nr:No66 [Symbiodinium microadriaticum]CAE7913622.1 No66 [Symbiodinium sp. KB8]